VAVGDDKVTFREGAPSDLETTFGLSELAIYDSGSRSGVIPAGFTPSEADIRSDWLRQRAFVEFIGAQPGRYVIAESGDGPVGYARVVRFGQMEELTELMVTPEHQGHGVGRQLLDIVWPGVPTQDLGRVVVAAGSPVDLSLYLSFGVMPIAGHWHMRQRTDAYLERRAQEIETTDPGVHLLKPERAVEEWKRLEPDAIGHERPALHEFFGRDRNCLASLDPASGDVKALCWVSSDGDIGPAVSGEPGDLAPVMIAALDRVAMIQEPQHLSVFATTHAWWLLRRLRGLGFSVYWPSWILCSQPLPGLDRYVPTRPPHLL
jgi:GNAT superfamily N-acetyltransferase